ncbi:CHAT domain-containing tetratricopeptide repeat protein [Oricola sp.]|uniref:CHAT domain-containing protein n=1 Tax=Oricola sp. TaxID=1979950 RepID=UPI0025D1F078|nr:CHAT domain-containing tetratricopeptide repeat protein [Oricola sp.]MCI5075233.1 CHAT domain-containing protein [Oricola sp.]
MTFVIRRILRSLAASAALTASIAAMPVPAAGETSPVEGQGQETMHAGPDIREPDAAEQARMADLESAMRDAFSAGDHAAAATAARALLAMEQATWGPEHGQTAGTHYFLGRVAEETGDLEGAADAYRTGLSIARRRLGATDPLTARFEEALGYVGFFLGIGALQEGDLAKAELRLKEALPLNQSATGPQSENTLYNLDALAIVLAERNRPSEALPLRRQTYELQSSLAGPDDATTLAFGEQLALLLQQSGKADDAIALYRDLARRREAALGPDHPDTLVTLNNLAVALNAAGRYDEALPLDRRVAAMRATVLGETDPETLIARANLASTLSNLGRYREAAALQAEVLDVRTATLGADHPETLHSMTELGIAFAKLGRLSEAETIQRRAAETLRDVVGPEARQTLFAQHSLATTLNAEGRFEEAESLFRTTLAAQEAVLEAGDRDTLSTAGNLALLLAKTGRTEEAIRHQEAIFDLSAQTLGRAHPDTLAAAGNLASSYLRIDDPAAAEPLNREVLRLSESGYGPDHPYTLTARNNLAVTLSALGERDAAAMQYDAVLKVRSALLPADHPERLTSLFNAGVGHFKTGDLENGLALLSAAAETREAVLGPLNPETLLSYTTLSQAQLANDQPRLALAAARKALAGEREVLTARAGAAGSGRETAAETSARAGAMVAFAAHALAIAETDSAGTLRDEAFAAIQSRSMDGAAEAMARAQARIAAGRVGLSREVAAWDDARAARDQLDVQLAASDMAGDAPLRRQLFKARDAAEEQVLASESRIRTGFPDFYELVAPPPLDLAEARTLLGPTEALILLFPGRGRETGLVWAVTRDDAAWAELPLPADRIETMIATLHRQLDGGSGTRAAAAKRQRRVQGYDRTMAHDLYAALFGAEAIAALIADKPDWIVSPQGALLSLQLNALVARPPQGEDTDPAALRDTAWLGLEHSLSILPTLSTLRSERQRGGETRSDNGLLFALGDPEFQGAAEASAPDARLTLPAAPQSRAAGVNALARLPGTRAEVQKLAALYGPDRSTVLLGAEASEARLRAEAERGTLASADTVLLATHGLIAGTFGTLAEPALALTPPQQPEGPENDGLLTASEAAQLRLSANWVILSACDTAAGGAPDAGGLTGLARGFFYAGAQSLLVSYWKVQDNTTARLTTGALAAMRKGEPRARAFRAAMQEVAADPSSDASLSLAHPSAWAPFQIIGVSRTPPQG